MTRLISLCVYCIYATFLLSLIYRDAFMVTSPGSSYSHTANPNYHSNLRSSSSDPLQLQLQPNTTTSSTSSSTSSSSSSWDVMCANGFILHGVYRDVYAYRSRYLVTIVDFINYIPQSLLVLLTVFSYLHVNISRVFFMLPYTILYICVYVHVW